MFSAQAINSSQIVHLVDPARVELAHTRRYRCMSNQRSIIWSARKDVDSGPNDISTLHMDCNTVPRAWSSRNQNGAYAYGLVDRQTISTVYPAFSRLCVSHPGISLLYTFSYTQTTGTIPNCHGYFIPYTRGKLESVPWYHPTSSL